MVRVSRSSKNNRGSLSLDSWQLAPHKQSSSVFAVSPPRWRRQSAALLRRWRFTMSSPVLLRTPSRRKIAYSLLVPTSSATWRRSGTGSRWSKKSFTTSSCWWLFISLLFRLSSSGTWQLLRKFDKKFKHDYERGLKQCYLRFFVLFSRFLTISPFWVEIFARTVSSAT